MLTKCCSDSCFCLWGMNKFTACLKREKRKREQRKQETGGREKTEDKQKGGERNEEK